MDLIVIFQQHKEAYPGQYAPDIVDACTEYQMEDGAGEFMDIKEDEAKKNPDIVAVRRVRLKFPDAFREEIRKLLLEEPVVQTPCKGVEPEDANGSRR